MDDKFHNRREAGKVLAQKLAHWAGRSDVVVLGLPRGGVPVAYEIARELRAPLDVFIVRKLGVPDRPELAMGAIASGGIVVLNEDVVRRLKASYWLIRAVAAAKEKELTRREREYRQGRKPPDCRRRTVILADDGLATGASMRAAVLALRRRSPGRIVAAVPVGTPGVCRKLMEVADEVVCAVQPEFMEAVGAWYEDFNQTTDDEVRELLDRGVGIPLNGDGGDE